jgi:hypothetical protein
MTPKLYSHPIRTFKFHFQILTIFRFKTVFDLQNFQYKSTDTNSRLAIGTVLLTAGATAKWSATAVSKDGDRPNEVTSNQNVYGIGASASATGSVGGYFSFQNFVSTTNGVTASGASLRAVALVNSEVNFSNDTSNQSGVSKNTDEAGLSLRRMWFAVNERVTQLTWDPSMGSNEVAENQVPTANGAPAMPMFFAMVFVLIALLFLNL